jgi:hypothetical protein
MELDFHAPASYRIRVKGYLEGSWSGRLGGMEIVWTEPQGGDSVTTLCGRLLDQGALIGVLNALYGLHLPLLSVECLAGGLAAEPVDADASAFSPNGSAGRGTGGGGVGHKDHKE